MKKRNIIISTFGTLGDVIPYISIAKTLQTYGHNVILATCEVHRNLCEKHNIRFKPLSPNLDISNGTLVKQMMNSRHGERLIFEEIMRNIDITYCELFDITADCDILINHCYCYAGPLVAEKRNLVWVSCHLSPTNFWSVFDPSSLSNSEYLIHLPKLGLIINKFIIKMARKQSLKWCLPLQKLRKEIGLPNNEHPVFEGLFSKYLSFALFSSEFAKPQLDWAKSCVQVGFVNSLSSSELEESELKEFIINKNYPLIIIALGSSVINNSDEIYSIIEQITFKSAYKFLFIGGNSENLQSTDKIFYSNAISYRSVFKYANLIIHHGGIGTTSDAMTAGVPMIILPQFIDQPDNAYRIKKLGIGEYIQKSKFNANTLLKMVEKITNDNTYYSKAKSISQKMSLDDANALILEKINEISSNLN